MAYIYCLAKKISVKNKSSKSDLDIYSDYFKNLIKNLKNHSSRLNKFFLEVSNGDCNFQNFYESEQEKFLERFYLLIESKKSYLKNEKGNNKLLSNLMTYRNDNINLELFEFDLFREYFKNKEDTLENYKKTIEQLNSDFKELKQQMRKKYLEGEEIDNSIDTTKLIFLKLDQAIKYLDKSYSDYKSLKDLNELEKIKHFSCFLDFSGDALIQFLIKVLIHNKILKKNKKILILTEIKEELNNIEKSLKKNYKKDKKDNDIFKIFLLLVSYSNISSLNLNYRNVLKYISSQVDLKKNSIPDKYISNQRFISKLGKKELIEELTFGDNKRILYYQKNKDQLNKNLKLTKKIIAILPSLERKFKSDYLQHFRGVFRELYENENKFKKRQSFKSIAKKLLKENSVGNIKKISREEEIFFHEVLSKSMFIECGEIEEYFLKNEIEDIIAKINLKLFFYKNVEITFEQTFEIYTKIFISIKKICKDNIL